MKITNNWQLPHPLFQALENDTYRQVGDISVTGLIRPPLMRQLEKRHADEIVYDATENVWSLLGRAVHYIIQNHGDNNRFAEERLTANVLGWQVSGQTDLFDEDEIITDYKVTSVYAFLLGDKPDWEAQLNLYAQLWRKHGFEPKGLRIVAILRDWMMRKANENGYPGVQVLNVEIPMWQPEDAERYLIERVNLHQAAEGLNVADIPLCTAEERWERPVTWAVKKPVNKRAFRVFDTYDEAVRCCAANAGMIIEERKGECVRCAHVCRAAAFCPFGKTIKQLAESQNASEDAA